MCFFSSSPCLGSIFKVSATKNVVEMHWHYNYFSPDLCRGELRKNMKPECQCISSLALTKKSRFN